ncbi:hypothetical protein [Allorhodopirellula heiligendammensis]|nr:hypothetical protein [Allorhodopirellula heiligendammensis]
MSFILRRVDQQDRLLVRCVEQCVGQFGFAGQFIHVSLRELW